MVKIRLQRQGKKRAPFYHIVVADSRSPRDGKFLEAVGTYDPIKKDCPVTVKEDRVLYWMNHGAVPTDTVRSIFSKQGIMKKFADSKVKAGK